MGYSDFLKARPEVLSEEGVEGIIDLANIHDHRKRKLEADPKLFFELTYPTSDIKRVIEKLHLRFNSPSATNGLFLFEGFKGSGKSHILLLVYYLFKNQKEAQGWLSKYNLQCKLPDDATVIINKFTDLPLFSIWDFIFEKTTSRKPKESVVQPTLKEVQEAVKDKKLVLIFDELEQGIGVINEGAVKKQNIAFLQMLSEWANRETQVTVFASIYSDREEPGATLKRGNPVNIKFTQTQDKNKVVLHRLFQNFHEFDVSKADSLVESYLNLWKKHIPSFDVLTYKERSKTAFPFLPDLLEIILEKVPARGGFQNVRGALGFLANLVKLTYQKTDLITAAHASLIDRETTYRLSDLDPSGDLINRAKENFEELKGIPLALGISSATLLYTLTETGRMRGVTRDELIRNVLTCDTDINEFEKALIAFPKYASHFRTQEGRFYFDLEENPDAKVEFRSLSILAPQAKEYLFQLWKEEIFKEVNNCIIFTTIDETKTALEEMEKDRNRFVFASRALTAEERHNLYHGITNRNLVVLLEPKDRAFDFEQNQDLLKWGMRQIAARELAGMTQDGERRSEYERIMREDKKYCLDTMRRTGISFIKWEKYESSFQQDQVEEEPLPGTSREDVLRFISDTIYPTQLFYEHLLKRIADIKGKMVKDVEQDYRITLGYPVPTFTVFTKAIRQLCKEKKVGIQHNRGNYCGEDPNLTESELSQAVVGEPFEVSQQPPAGPPVSREGVAPLGPVPGTSALPVTSERVESVTVPYQSNIGELRQNAAVKLQAFGEAKITKIELKLYLNPQEVDLGSLPAAYRGNITGEGEIAMEITLMKSGEFSKGQIESLIESMPNIKNAEYSVKLEIRTKEEK